MKKIGKLSCIEFSQNFKNLIFGSFSAPFGPKISKQIFSQKIILFILSLYDVEVLKIPEKPHFGSISGLIWTKNFKTKLLPKKSFASKKSEKFLAPTFDNT